MKKLVLLCIFMLLICFPFIPFSNFAKAEHASIYAKVAYKNVFLYSLPEDKDENRLFEIPYSYFVLLLANENGEFYYAQYDDIFGFVKKSAVTAMKGTPLSPYATSNFRVFSLDGIGFYKSPNTTSEKLANIPYLSEELTYYGIMQGEEVIPEKTSEWYFAKNSTSGNFGYVYSVFCDKLPTIKNNTETFETISSPLFSNDKAGEELSPVSMAFIIIGVSLPCLIVLYLLVKPSMISQKLTKSKPKLKAKRSRDYFEFDEGDLT